MSNLISEWKFDELTTAIEGTTIQDSWSGGNNGTLDTYVATVDSVDKLKTGTDCVSGKCLFFDGIDDYISTGNINISTNAISISVWVKFVSSGTGTRTIISKPEIASGVGNPIFVIDYMSTANGLRWFGYLNEGLRGFSNGILMLDSGWTHIVGTFDGTTWKAYKNGETPVTIISAGTILTTSNYNLLIGARNIDSSFWSGLMDDVRIYNTVMSTSQIKEQYYAGLNSLLSLNQIDSKEYIERINSIAQQ